MLKMQDPLDNNNKELARRKAAHLGPCAGRGSPLVAGSSLCALRAQIAVTQAAKTRFCLLFVEIIPHITIK
jgi:hypothetical protein